VQAAGFKPFVVTSDVPGKGVLFRVRVGDYVSKDAAIAEKATVESKLKVAAYLAKL
jgi:cell division septation protein DedD